MGRREDEVKEREKYLLHTSTTDLLDDKPILKVLEEGHRNYPEISKFKDMEEEGATLDSSPFSLTSKKEDDI